VRAEGGHLLESGILPRVALYLAAQLTCALLAAYGFVRSDRRASRFALILCFLGLFLVQLARTMQLLSFTGAPRPLPASLALAGLVAAAAGGGEFVAHLARRRGHSRAGWVGLALALAVNLAAQPFLALPSVDRVVPAAPALAVLALAAGMLARRRLLFPGLDRMVLEASVPESGGSIVVFGADGRFIDTGSGGPAALLARGGRGSIAAFLALVHRRLASGSFFSAGEIEGLGADEPGREIALDLPGGIVHFLVFANPVREGQGPRLGVVFGFYDISRQKRIEAELAASNTELDAKNAQLRGYLAVAGELEEERERRKVAEEIHRTLGTRIAGLHAAVREGGTGGPAALEELLAGCRGVIGEIRSTVRSLDPDRGRGGGPP
jgi:signal transduction histidine kinase